jgi:hypothetical protein
MQFSFVAFIEILMVSPSQGLLVISPYFLDRQTTCS